MINEKYSYKDFTGKDLSNIPASEFTGTIAGSCFFQPPQIGPRKVLPDGIECEFRDCNMGNVILSDGCTLTGTSSNDYIVMYNGEAWVQSKNGLLAERVGVII